MKPSSHDDLGNKASFTANRNKLTASSILKEVWIDPRTGDSKEIGRFSNPGVESFSTPDEWEDALLILEP